ncbi:hypothetical protein FA893_11640 [Photobacterium damselae subsp. piscicida]|uniref:hypothetical protein n=1 Tax=Photobacterium damselae TaxID=38293 RepID=UPI0002E071B4|nr:hypothetical protein [Photobacterium damselae]OLQ80775.1 hypothetical protein BEI67_12430 [Photobacterium damselae subsp. piscicida]TFZ56342.1 hypothetical protein E4T25_12405 [Photobacterium damselae subsp. piscicida]TJZ89903.1 hypothetical protein FA893_11640 [Photobacterium damselae subsp. piscicida]BBC40496.1 hypothetical protein PDPE_1-01336 [Photobacterium damselae subsp. piscicida]
MTFSIQLPCEFSDTNIINKQNVISLSTQGNYDELNKVVICKDHSDNITARFGDDLWDIKPYCPDHISHTTFNFYDYIDSPSLMLELKLIVFGWLFHKSGKTNTSCKPSTLLSRFSKLKRVYSFLLDNGYQSLSALSDQAVWLAYQNLLIEKEYSQQTVGLILGAINNVLFLQPWLKINFGLSKLETKVLSKQLSKKMQQQTLVIPESLSDVIYGKAIELVEFGYKYREVFAKIENELQNNYLQGKQFVDNKIQSSANSWLIDENGNINNTQDYANEINRHQPQTHSMILKRHTFNIEDCDILNDGIDFRRFYGQLISACYICCGAFSGMRESELSQLTPKSFYCEEYNDRKFYMLQSRTFKLGEKDETWVTAPVVKKAIELVSTLTEKWRFELSNIDNAYKNTLWINRIYRSKSPNIITNWSERLKRFCKQFQFITSDSDYQECLNSNPNSREKISSSIKIGKPWPLTSHQFRRSLAFYTIKHRLGTSFSLKQQFKHLYLQMTEWYTNGGRLASFKGLRLDSELQQLLDNIKDEHTTNIIFNMVHSNKILSGSHGKAIMKMRDDIPHIYSSWDVIYTAIKNKNLTLHGTAHGYCKNGYNCDMDGVVNPAFCIDCSSGSSIIDEENAKWWQKKHLQLTTYLSNELDVSPSEYSHCITQIRAAEIIMKDFDIEYITYQHPIKIIEL